MVRRVLIITGPTGSGKSRVGLIAAERWCGEIINADSVQVYRGFDIGAAKPDADELARAPHHLVSILDPDEPFDAAQFAARASDAILDVSERGKLPVVVGGTGLYLRALLGGLIDVPPVTQAAERAIAERCGELESRGCGRSEIVQSLHEWLHERDPQTAGRISPADAQRVRRALAVSLSSGVSLAQLHDGQSVSVMPLDALVCALLPPRERLYRAIDERVTRMFETGFVDEVRRLREAGFAGVKPMHSIGYRQVNEMLASNGEVAVTAAAIRQATRHFAKRQYTWWRHQPQKLGWQMDGVSPEKVKYGEPGGAADLWQTMSSFVASAVSDVARVRYVSFAEWTADCPAESS